MQRSGLYALLGIAAVLVALALLVLYRPTTTPSDRLTVVAGANFWGSLARQIGGDDISVTSILNDPSADPHLFESDATTAAAVARADIVIVNGLGYDEFLQKLLSASPKSDRTVVNAAEVVGAQPGDNPHLWYDVPRIPYMISAIKDALSAKDPAKTDIYQANALTLNLELEPLLRVIDQIKTQYPGAPVVYTEPVAAYLLSAAGLDIKTPEGFALAIESGEEPSPADQQALKELLVSRSVRVLLYNSQAVTTVTEELKAIAQSAGVPIVPVTETIPEAEPTYQSWQHHQAEAILSALHQSAVQGSALER